MPTSTGSPDPDSEQETRRVHSAPLPVQTIDGPDVVPNAELFLSHEFTDRLHVFALYATTEVYHRQFQGLDWLPSQPTTMLSLIGPARILDERLAVPLALLPDEMAPAGLQTMFTSLPVLTVTTLSTWQQEAEQTHLRDLERAFVVVDQPLQSQLEEWAEQGLHPRFATTALDTNPLLHRLTITVDQFPNCVFLAFGTETGDREFTSLVDTFSSDTRATPEPDDVREGEVNAVTAQLLNSWWSLHDE